MHRRYADQLLELALEYTLDEYGDVEIRQQPVETVVGRQLKQITISDGLSVAVAMPTQDWLEKAILVPVPLLRGLPSFRMFLGRNSERENLSRIMSSDELRTLLIGQGRGWSTANILEENQFQVVYATRYEQLIPILNANRFDILMRGSYEIGAEWNAFRDEEPLFYIVENFAVFTYLPMYFFVNENNPELAKRIYEGLDKAFDEGAMQALFDEYFKNYIPCISQTNKLFCLTNSNITPALFENDRKYLLPSVIETYDTAMLSPSGTQVLVGQGADESCFWSE